MITSVPSSLAFRVAEDQVHLLADHRVRAANPPHKIAEVEREQRGDRHHHHRQPPVPCQKQRGDGHRRPQVSQDREGLARDKDLNRADVVHQPRDDRPAGILIIVRQAQLLEPFVKQMPQVADHPLADLANDQAVEPDQDRLRPNTPKSKRA